mmetsp:Transcript_21213/g.54783  ORF Transcript_21213/g.54783 Transcript_21213/m.54783 type:complete len:224 (-) Transcript_21213:1546-2217(-)
MYSSLLIEPTEYLLAASVGPALGWIFEPVDDISTDLCAAQEGMSGNWSVFVVSNGTTTSKSRRPIGGSSTGPKLRMYFPSSVTERSVCAATGSPVATSITATSSRQLGTSTNRVSVQGSELSTVSRTLSDMGGQAQVDSTDSRITTGRSSSPPYMPNGTRALGTAARAISRRAVGPPPLPPPLPPAPSRPPSPIVRPTVASMSSMRMVRAWVIRRYVSLVKNE